MHQENKPKIDVRQQIVLSFVKDNQGTPGKMKTIEHNTIDYFFLEYEYLCEYQTPGSE